MKNLKEALRACPKPEIQVPEFKAQLRESLRAEQAWRSQRRTPWLAPAGFIVMASLVVIFGVLLTFFVIRPDIPEHLNRWVVKQTEQASSVPQKKDPVNAAFVPNHNKQQELNALLAGEYKEVFSAEQDKDFAQKWVREHFPQISSQVRSIEQEKIVTLRWVRLDNGRKVLVMNEFDADKIKNSRVVPSDLNGGIL